MPSKELLGSGVPATQFAPKGIFGAPDPEVGIATDVEQAQAWLAGNEPVIALDIDGEARAYPLQILTWHEIVNDTVSGVPVMVTFCPLCNTALVFEREIEGTVHDFGVSGNLRLSDMVMYDRETQSWWQQAIGEGIVGETYRAAVQRIRSLGGRAGALGEGKPGLARARQRCVSAAGFLVRYRFSGSAAYYLEKLGRTSGKIHPL